MNEEDRQTMVKLEIEKAHTFLTQAEDMFSQKYWDLAANRYYYACFHAVTALLIANGLSGHSHKGLIAMFGLHFVVPGKIDSRHGSFLTRMEQLRMKGDYNCLFAVTEEEIQTMRQPAKELVKAVENLIES